MESSSLHETEDDRLIVEGQGEDSILATSISGSASAIVTGDGVVVSVDHVSVGDDGNSKH